MVPPDEDLLITSRAISTDILDFRARELFYRRGDAMMTVAVAVEPTFTPSVAQRLFQDEYFDQETDHRHFTIAPDGQRFLMIKEGDGTAAPQQHRGGAELARRVEAAGACGLSPLVTDQDCGRHCQVEKNSVALPPRHRHLGLP